MAPTLISSWEAATAGRARGPQATIERRTGLDRYPHIMQVMDDDLSPEAWLGREVLAHYGRVMYQAQVLEHGIVNLIVWTDVARQDHNTEMKVEARYETLFRETFGGLRRILTASRKDIDHLQGEIEKALSLRNFLAHRYFRERAAAVMYEQGQHQMIDELKRAHDFFVGLDAKLDVFTYQVLQELGLLEKLHELVAEDPEDHAFGSPLPGI